MVKKNKAYKFRLYPNTIQQTMIDKTIGCGRFIYNQMLSDKIKHYELTKERLNNTPAQYKKEYEWLKEVDSYALCNAQMNLQTAFNNFFRGRGKVGFPKFKSKHKSTLSYTTNNVNGVIRVESKFIQLPKIKNIRIKQHRTIPTNQTIKSCTISKTRTNKYFVSILVEWYEEKQEISLDKNKAIGLDYSSPHFYIDSQNMKAGYPKFYSNSQRKLAKEQRKLSRCVKGSNNYRKQKLRIALISEHIANQRKDFLEKLSCQISKNYDIVCIEDLNMKHMSQCLKLGKNTMDNGWGMFTIMLGTKVKQLVKVDKWFPSSKTCNHCGLINKQLTLNDREWDCECGNVIDRDFNAAKNILQEGLRIMI